MNTTQQWFLPVPFSGLVLASRVELVRESRSPTLMNKGRGALAGGASCGGAGCGPPPASATYLGVLMPVELRREPGLRQCQPLRRCLHHSLPGRDPGPHRAGVSPATNSGYDKSECLRSPPSQQTLYERVLQECH